MGEQNLTATYKSPSAKCEFTRELPTLAANPSTAEKTAYLSALRAGASQMQAEVNEYLTARMEENKATDGGGKDKKGEEKEEEMYGEEDVQDEG